MTRAVRTPAYAERAEGRQDGAECGTGPAVGNPRALDGARNGIAISKLASMQRVHTRTVRRDVDALCKAGFPLYDEKVNGTSMWRLRAKPFRAVSRRPASA